MFSLCNVMIESRANGKTGVAKCWIIPYKSSCFLGVCLKKGESGTLDYIIASASAASQKLGETVHYSVNADETGALE